MSDERRLERKVRRLFSGATAAEVLHVLDRYSGPERVRVKLAVLKCSGDDLAKVQEGIELATRDYRDILAGAEYPRQMAIPVAEFNAMSPSERRAVLRADRDEYETWPDDDAEVS